tara:strand:- start:455 stop:790 length:336 start_codon:yes stop_codon:yes gene_type:complete
VIKDMGLTYGSSDCSSFAYSDFHLDLKVTLRTKSCYFYAHFSYCEPRDFMAKKVIEMKAKISEIEANSKPHIRIFRGEPKVVVKHSGPFRDISFKDGIIKYGLFSWDRLKL